MASIFAVSSYNIYEEDGDMSDSFHQQYVVLKMVEKGMGIQMTSYGPGQCRQSLLRCCPCQKRIGWQVRFGLLFFFTLLKYTSTLAKDQSSVSPTISCFCHQSLDLHIFPYLSWFRFCMFPAGGRGVPSLQPANLPPILIRQVFKDFQDAKSLRDDSLALLTALVASVWLSRCTCPQRSSSHFAFVFQVLILFMYI